MKTFIHTVANSVLKFGQMLLVFYAFLDGPSHLYKRVCPSVRRSVTPAQKCVLGASNGQYWLLLFTVRMKDGENNNPAS